MGDEITVIMQRLLYINKVGEVSYSLLYLLHTREKERILKENKKRK
jgi:hypothetical protein